MSDGSLIFDTKLDTKSYAKQLSTLESTINKLNKKMEKIENQKIPTNEFVEVQKQIDETTNKLNKLIDRSLKLEELGVDKESKSWKSLQYDIAAVQRVLEEAKVDMKDIRKNGQDFVLGKDTDEYKKMNEELEKAVQKTNDLKRANAETQKSYVQMSDESKKSLSIIEKTIKRISSRFYSRILYKGISNVLNSIKTGMQDLAKYSDSFNKNLSNMQSSFIQSRNAISTAFMPALVALEPIITKISNAIAEFATNIAMYTTALFTNNKTYIRAKKVTTDYAKSLNSVDKAQKNLLANFDEIDILNNKQNGGLGISSQDMFEEVDIPENVIANAEKLKETWEKIKPYIEAAGIALAAFAVGNEASKIGNWISKLTGANKATKSLTDSMLDKNSALGDQTVQTQKETVALRNLVPKLAGAGAGVWALSRSIKNFNENELQIPELQPLEAFSNAMQESSKVGNESLNSLKDGFKLFSKQTSEISSELYDTEKENSNIFSKILRSNFQLLFDATSLGTLVWGRNVSTNMYKVFKNIMDNAKEAFKSANVNANSFFETTSENTVSWGKNFIENCGKTMSSWHERFVSALQSAWQQFVEFMEATGQSITKWWRGNKKWVIPTALVLGTVAGIALAPFTGGSSLSLCALANGTVVPANYGEFAAILGDNKKEPEVVSPLSTMKQAFIEAMNESGYAGNGNTTVILELEGRELGRVVYKLNKRESQRIGVSTRVTGGAY